MESYEIARQLLHERMKALEIEIEDNFVPFSVSRNKNEKMKSLNWIILLKVKGRLVLRADYTAGVGHAPAMKLSRNTRNMRGILPSDLARMADIECEEGRAVRKMSPDLERPIFVKADSTVRIRPDHVDVLSSLLTDASVIDYPTFEEWASAMGFDSDSRRGEAIYRACLEIGLKLRNAIGGSTMEELRGIAGQM